jgi:hypothetical protein
MVSELRTECGNPHQAATEAPVIAQECVGTLKGRFREESANQGGTTILQSSLMQSASGTIFLHPLRKSQKECEKL